MTQYKQTEICLDLKEGNTNSLPTWMKGLQNSPNPLSLKPSQIQLPLFDISPYVSTKTTTAPTQTSRADRHRQAAISG